MTPVIYNYVLCPCRVLSAIAFAAIKVEYSFSSNNIIWCIFIQTFRFPLTSVKKGDMFGFGIRGDWESEFHAGPHCRLYFTLNGTEVWTVGLINCLIINWIIYWFFDQLVKWWNNLSIKLLNDLLIYWTDDEVKINLQIHW